MKRIISLFAVLVIFASFLTGCGSKSADTQRKGSGISIVTTIFPIYDWVKNIAGDNLNDMDLTMLLDNGVDQHSYQPTVDDIIKISSCDVFIYVGGESDKWVDDALSQAVNKEMAVIDLLDILGDSVKEEELVEGMEAEHEEDAEEGESEEEETEYDEHVWLSLRNASVLVDKIAGVIAGKDSVNADAYLANAADYVRELNAVDADFKEKSAGFSLKTLVFADRFPFRYFCDDYDIDYYAAFAGCSAETEASFETVAFLAAKVDELGLKSVLMIDGGDGRIAQTVVKTAENEDVRILSVNSMQSVTANDVADGATYLSIMKTNLDTFAQALA